MSYDYFIDTFIHPYILYVVFGTILSYLLARLAVRLRLCPDAGSKAVIYSMPFAVPVISYILYEPFMTSGCFLTGKPWGVVNDWLCDIGKVLAEILTPLFIVVTVFALFKAGLSIFASRRIVRKYGYSSLQDYPVLVGILNDLCRRSDIRVPRVVVTRDRFARSFTMGYRSPVIVLSEGLLDVLDQQELETVVAHELGHIDRADSLVTWLTVFLRDLMFFTPLVFWIFRDLTAEKEKASDDFAVRLTGRPLAFAEALIKVWRLSPRKFFDNFVLDNFTPYPSFVSHSGILEYRVKRILNENNGTVNHCWQGYTAALAVVFLSVAMLHWFC